jgi:hypothetical protein
MAMQKTAMVGLAVAVATILTLTSVVALLQSSKTFQNSGTVTAINVGVYQDSACTQVLSLLDWGSIGPGSSANRTIYIKNDGTTAMTLNMTVSAWNPASASSYIGLTWNREGTVLNQGNSAAALLTLTVSASITGITSFNYNVTITGTQ